MKLKLKYLKIVIFAGLFSTILFGCCQDDNVTAEDIAMYEMLDWTNTDCYSMASDSYKDDRYVIDSIKLFRITALKTFLGKILNEEESRCFDQSSSAIKIYQTKLAIMKDVVERDENGEQFGDDSKERKIWNDTNWIWEKRLWKEILGGDLTTYGQPPKDRKSVPIKEAIKTKTNQATRGASKKSGERFEKIKPVPSVW